MISPVLLALAAFGLAADQPNAAASLAWMSGCWEGQLGPVTLEEVWTKPAGGTLMGISRNLKGGKVLFSEFMRIEERADGVYYVARIGDAKQPPTPFKLVRASREEAVFENPQHDFPQRIIYRVAADGLNARIEGTEKGKTRGEDYPLKTAACR